MAKSCYIGVDGKARKVKKGYVGVDGKARKIKKAYIGVGGVARPCWSGGELVYYGEITPLTAGRYKLAGASNNNYALFAGGAPNPMTSNDTNVVECYDASLTKTDAPNLTSSVESLAGARNESYALFAGGFYNGRTNKATVDAYDDSLTKSTATDLTTATYYLAGANVGQYALFAGGYLSSSSSYSISDVNAYDNNLTKSTPTSLRISAYNLCGGNVGQYALFAGGERWNASGYYSEASKTVTAYDTSLTRIDAPDLQTGRRLLGSANAGECLLFAGGAASSSSTTLYSQVDVYDKNLTRKKGTALSKARKSLVGVSVGGYAVFARTTNGANDMTDVYDKNLTRTKIQGNMATSSYSNDMRENLAGASIGNYAIFAGGSGTNLSALVDVYTVS